jgi:hypothetical protein
MAGKPAAKSTKSSGGGKASLGSKVSLIKPKKKRPGVVSKNNTSNIKSSRNYKKAYRGQGR